MMVFSTLPMDMDAKCCFAELGAHRICEDVSGEPEIGIDGSCIKLSAKAIKPQYANLSNKEISYIMEGKIRELLVHVYGIQFYQISANCYICNKTGEVSFEIYIDIL